MRRTSLLQVILVLIAATAPAAAQQALSVTSTFAQLSIANATRGGRVIVAGISIQSDGGARRLRRVDVVLVDEDGDGNVTFVPEGKVPRRSIWVVSDLSSGATVTAAGPELSGYLTALPAATLRKDVDGFVSGLEANAVEIDLLLIRPKQGAWIRHGYEGSSEDEDAAVNSKLRVSFASATPLAADFGESPKKAKKGDIVAVIDIRRLRLALASIE